MDENPSLVAPQPRDIRACRAVRQFHAYSWNELDERIVRPRRRKRINDLTRDHALLDDILNVDQWRGTGHRDRFFESSDRHLGVYRRCKGRRYFYAFPPNQAEARQTKRDHVRTG